MEPLLPKSSLEINILFLQIFGLWFPDGNDSQIKKYLYNFWSTFIHLIFFGTYNLGEFMNIYTAGLNIEEIIGTCLLWFTHLATLVKVITFIFKQRRIKQLTDTLNSDLFIPKYLKQINMLKPVMINLDKTSRIFLIMCVITCLLWAIFPSLEKQRRLPLRVWTPYNHLKSPLFEVTVIYQTFNAMCQGLANISMDTFIAGIMAHACIQVKILCDSLKNIRERTLEDFQKLNVDISMPIKEKSIGFQKILKNNFLNYVIHHRQIVNYVNEVQSIFSTAIFIQIAASVIIICMTAFQINLVKPFSLQWMSMVIYLSCILLEIYLFCWYGNDLIVESNILSTAIYCSTWYEKEYNQEFKQELIFFMMCISKPLTFRAGGFFTLSLEMFTTILKSSYTYYAVLKTTQ